MKRAIDCALIILFLLIVFHAASVSAWDSQWKITQRSYANSLGSSARDIEMRPRYDTSPMTTFRGTIDASSGYTVMRNPNGSTMRGYIDNEGFSLLRDQNGNFHRVNPRW